MFINGSEFNPPRYSSGELKLKHDYLESFIKNEQVTILYNNDTMSLFELIILCNYYINKRIKTNLILSYLPYQRMNHANTNEVETVKYVADLLNNIGLNSIAICEPHCELDYFNNAKKIKIVEKIFEKVKKTINFNENSDVIVFTDKGSVEKFRSIGKNKIYGIKSRDKSTGLICSYTLSKQIEPNQKVIIVDDIISTGDTILEVLNTIKPNQNNQVYIISGHFEQNKYNQRLIENDLVKAIFSSNSLTKNEQEKLKLFDIKELIYD